jgi:hypothetical protein
MANATDSMIVVMNGLNMIKVIIITAANNA